MEVGTEKGYIKRKTGKNSKVKMAFAFAYLQIPMVTSSIFYTLMICNIKKKPEGLFDFSFVGGLQ